MNSHHHFILSLFLLVLYPFFGPSIFISLLWATLIDLDHVHLVFREKAYTLKKIRKLINNIQSIYKSQGHERFKGTVYLFHTLEFNLVLFTLAQLYPLLYYVLIGGAFHILTDIISHWPSKRWLLIATSIK